jgi:hypothetical protein
MSDKNGTWAFITNMFFAATGAASANLLANVACRNRQGTIDWRDLAILTSIGATLGVHYAKTGRPFFLSNQ